MKYFYAKYKYSKLMRFLRMCIVLGISLALFIVGIVRVFDESVTGGFKVFSWITLIAGAILVLVVGFTEIYKEWELGKLYPIIAVTLGIIFIFLIPAFETPDEQDHFGSAYNLSNVIVDYGSPYEDGEEGLLPIRYMRAEDASIKEADTVSKLDVSSYDKIFNHLGIVDKSGSTKVIAVDFSANAGYVLYILPALGITIARLLSLGFGWAYVLGALLNLLLYVVLTTYAIRKIPVGKRILFVVSLLPITLQQVSSFSYDCGLIACIMVVVSQAFFLKCGNPESRRKIRWNIEIPIIRTTITEFVMYILCAVMMFQVKSGVFLIVLLLPFVLCINKRWFTGSNKKITIPIIVVLVLLSAAYLIFFGGWARIVTFLTTSPENVREIQGLTGVAPIDYITNPSRFFGIVFTTLKENAGHYLAQIGGTALGYNRIFITKGVYIVNLLMILVSMVRYEKESDTYKAGNRILTFIIGIIPIMITALAMLLYWTLPTDNVITGFQGRYIVPTLTIMMLSVGRWKKIRIPDIDGIFAVGMTITGYVTCISVLQM